VPAPFRDNTFSRVLCAHVLYHLPPRRQRWALLEIHRVLAKDGLAVVVYAQPPTPLSRLGERRRSTADPAPERPPLPYHPVGYPELCRDLAGRMSIEVRTFSLLESELTRAVVPGNVVGRAVLALASAAEVALPKATLRLARYPMIIIRKGS
jgi:SAM-dependent methyltransferase